MIKAEVVFRGNKVNINGFLVIKDGELWDIYIVDGNYVDSRINLEQAIKYRMEH